MEIQDEYDTATNSRELRNDREIRRIRWEHRCLPKKSSLKVVSAQEGLVSRLCESQKHILSCTVFTIGNFSLEKSNSSDGNHKIVEVLL